ncbi:MAG: diadenylate cyclase [Alistipes sp.]|nr:diadenylate cyclase [Candidatus Minthomonas equi]
MFEFINISIADVVDVLLVAIIIYQLFRMLRGTAAFSVFLAIISLYFLNLLMLVLKMKLMSNILSQILGVGMVAIIIIFQQEIRRYLLHFGNAISAKMSHHVMLRQLFNTNSSRIKKSSIDEISMACKSMSNTRTGALIILTHSASIDFVIETGDIIDAAIHRRLIENLFFKNSPLHDGAMVIASDRIIAARCTLPIIENPDIPPQFGLRHRAAVSITKDTDADAIVVSEETGNISFVTNGELNICTSISQLRLYIENAYRK